MQRCTTTRNFIKTIYRSRSYILYRNRYTMIMITNINDHQNKIFDFTVPVGIPLEKGTFGQILKGKNFLPLEAMISLERPCDTSMGVK
jgi:hypothetical protein